MPAYLTFVHALSPLHAGTGQGAGVIDLPIAREKATGLPFLPGSSVKGTLRDGMIDEARQRDVFGSKRGVEPGEELAGAGQFSDQRLLLLPIRSLAGTFAWVTSPYLLSRFARDAEDCGITSLPGVPKLAAQDMCVVAKDGCQLICKVAGTDRVVLEDLDLRPAIQTAVDTWAKVIGDWLFPTYDSAASDIGIQPPNTVDTQAASADDTLWQTMLAGRLCIVHDDVLSFLLTTATEIIARISLEPEKKTVTDGGLWYEEALPTETVLSGLLVIDPPGDKRRPGVAPRREQQISAALSDLQRLTQRTMQFGGKATIGRGLCRVRITAPPKGV